MVMTQLLFEISFFDPMAQILHESLLDPWWIKEFFFLIIFSFQKMINGFDHDLETHTSLEMRI